MKSVAKELDQLDRPYSFYLKDSHPEWNAVTESTLHLRHHWLFGRGVIE